MKEPLVKSDNIFGTSYTYYGTSIKERLSQIEEIEAFMNFVKQELKTINQLKFDLTYYAKVQPSESDNMSVNELKIWHEMLYNIKLEEFEKRQQPQE